MKKNRKLLIVLLLCLCCQCMYAQPGHDTARHIASARNRYRNYMLLNAGEPIPLYSRTMLAQRKGVQTITRYYFRKCDTSAMLPLTVANLQDAYKTETAFATLLEKYFHYDDMLLRYDKQARMYRLNVIYKELHHN